MEYERIINEANEKSYALEYEIFTEVKNKVSYYLTSILKMAKIISIIDVYSSLSILAKEDNYTKPIFYKIFWICFFPSSVNVPGMCPSFSLLL